MPIKGESKREPQGWGAVARRRKEIEEKREEAESAVRDFWTKVGESAVIQFLQAEPFCFDAHVVEDSRGNVKTVPCQLMNKRRCTLCSDGVKKTWKAAFKILDYRGNWDKDSKKFLNDEKIEKLWVVGTILATKLQQISVKRGKDLTELVFEVTYNGKGDYNLEAALDDDDRKLKPVEWKEKMPTAEELCQPPTDDEIDEKGYVGKEYKK